MNKLKKAAKFLTSMKFAIILLLLLILACVFGSIIVQNQTYDWYAATYSERQAALILALHLDDVFHSWWFIVLTGFLCINLLTCNLIRLPSLIKRFKAEKNGSNFSENKATVSQDQVSDIDKVFHNLKISAGKEIRDPEGCEVIYASKNRAGIFGAWVCHLGILLLILGFAAGQMTKKQYTVYGVPGQTKPIGDTSYELTINDFRVDLREDDTVSQYTADITVKNKATDPSGNSGRAEISVNHPATLFGMKFYQNSTGYAATLKVQKEGELIQEEKVVSGDYAEIKDRPGLSVYLNAFYPDFQIVDGNPMSISDKMNNPAYLYSIYYQNEFVGMNALMAGEEIKVNDYVITFSDPSYYTVIQVKRERFTGVAFAGGIITLLGLFLAFYMIPVSVWAVKTEDGTYTVYGRCTKKGSIFEEEFREAVETGKGDLI